MGKFTAIFSILALACVWISEGNGQNQNTCSAPITPTKTGTCPRPNPDVRCIHCYDNCYSDSQCPGDDKCCPQPGCGNGCRDPIPGNQTPCNTPITSSKPGTCPKPDLAMLCVTCNDNCVSDFQCRDDDKCCPQPGCGNMCKDPVNNNVNTCDAQITPSKPGNCPWPNPNLNCIHCYDNCRADFQCRGDDKCCPQPGCGNACMDPLPWRNQGNNAQPK